MSQFILAWENTDQLAVETWQIDILKEEMVGGIKTMVPQIQFFQEKDYLSVNNEYMTTDHYYRIYGLDANGSVIVDNGDFVPTAVGYDIDFICEKKCNGDYYAYEVEQYGSSTAGYFLSPKHTIAWYDDDTHTATPYYHYVSQATWNNWLTSTTTTTFPYPYPKYKTIRFNTDILPTNAVKDGQGNGLTGDVVGIEKKMGEYDVYNGKKTTPLASLQPCNSLGGFLSTFNQNKTNCNQANVVYPTLTCVPDPNTFTMVDGKPIFGTDPTAHDSCDTCLYKYQNVFTWIPGDTLFIDPNLPGKGSILTYANLNNAFEYWTNNNVFTAADFNQFEIQKVGDSSFSLILEPSDVEQSNGSLSFSNYPLSDGLYKMNIFYSNNVLFPVYFESAGQVSAPNTSLSNYLSAIIYPVPIINSEFSISFAAQRDLNFTYEMFDLNGNLLGSKAFYIESGDEIIYHTSIDPNINLPSNMLVNKFTFDDGSSFTIQTITSFN